MKGRSRRGSRRGEEETDAAFVYGVHPVLEALTAASPRVERVFVARDLQARTGRLFREARERGVPVSHVDRELLRRKTGAGAVHQGVAALLSAAPYRRADELVDEIVRTREAPLVVALDGVEDPRNLGAVLRSAAAAGADGVLLGTGRTVGLTPGAVKSSSGAALRVPIARDPHLAETLHRLHSSGWSVVALVSAGGRPPESIPGNRPVAVLGGGEARGLRAGLLDSCPLRVTIPMAEGAGSLNLSVAVGVVLFEVRRQRRGKLGSV